MAQTKNKRRRKHRGTPAGTIERAGRTGRPKTREEAKQIARQRREARLDQPPTWSGSAKRAGVAAAIFAVVVIALLGRPVTTGLFLGVVMFAIYVPLGYSTDSAIYKFRQRRKQAAAADRQANRK